MFEVSSSKNSHFPTPDAINNYMMSNNTHKRSSLATQPRRRDEEYTKDDSIEELNPSFQVCNIKNNLLPSHFTISTIRMPKDTLKRSSLVHVSVSLVTPPPPPPL